MNQVTNAPAKEVITLSPASAVVALWGDLTKESLENFKVQCLAMKVEDPENKVALKQVYEARQIAKNHRLRVDKLEKKLKTDANTYRDVVGKTAKEIRAFFKESETHLQEQEDIVKREKERIAQEEQIHKQEAHDLQIQQLVDAGAVFSGVTYVWGDQQISDADVWNMSPFDFDEYLKGVCAWKTEDNARIAREAAARKEEEERQAAIAEENRKRQEELDRRQAELDAKEESQRKAQEKIDRELREKEEAKKVEPKPVTPEPTPTPTPTPTPEPTPQPTLVLTPEVVDNTLGEEQKKEDRLAISNFLETLKKLQFPGGLHTEEAREIVTNSQPHIARLVDYITTALGTI